MKTSEAPRDLPDQGDRTTILVRGTAPESKHLTPKNEISDFFGSGIDSDISGIARDPPGGLLVGTKLVSQNLAGF